MADATFGADHVYPPEHLMLLVTPFFFFFFGSSSCCKCLRFVCVLFFFFSNLLLTFKLLEQGYVATRLMSPLQKFNGRRHDLVDRYGVSICTMQTDLFNVS